MVTRLPAGTRIKAGARLVASSRTSTGRYQLNGTLPIDLAMAAGTPIVGAFGFRALSTYWQSSNGPLADLRRSSDNATMTAYSTNGLFPTAAVLAWAGMASVYLTRWYDQTGLGRHAIQATATTQPQLVNAGSMNVQNGQVSALYSSSSLASPIPQLSLSNTTYLNCTMQVVTRQSVPGLFSWRGGGCALNLTAGATNNYGNAMGYNYNDISGTYGFVGNSLPVSTNLIAELVLSPTSASIFLNNSSSTNNVANTPSPPSHTATLQLGIDNGGYFSGLIGEALILANSTPRTAIYANQKAYWGFG